MKNMTKLFGVVAAVLVAISGSAAAQSGSTGVRAAASVGAVNRVALVMGNSAYKDAPLLNPVNDAKAIAAALRAQGFEVILRENTDQRGMSAAVREFGDRLKQRGGVGLFYFAGHGMQIKGRNYLIPVGAQIEREDEVAYNAVDAQAVLDKMEAAGNGTNLMILDACRNNPFARSFRSGSAGLAPMDAPVGTLVAFATAPGMTASDGSGANGLYTQHLLTAMQQPGMKVEDVFKQVRSNVRRDSQNKQVPWEATSLEGDFYFSGAAGSAVAGDALDQAFWDAVKSSTQAVEIRAYLNRFPQGKFAADARARMASLTIASAPTTPRPAAQLPSPAGVGTGPSASSGANDQADIDRRTQELLAEIGGAPGAPGAIAAAAPVGKSISRNAHGYAIGDVYRLQLIDKYKGEVINNFAYRLTRFGPQGEIFTGGATVLTADGQLKSAKSNDGTQRDWAPHNQRWYAGIKPGDERDVGWITSFTAPDGRQWQVSTKGKLRAVGLERIKVPAGEFEAVKVIVSGFSARHHDGRQGAATGSFTNTYWYVPSLRYHAAADFESRDTNGRTETNSREELTSVSLN
jgi:Caspase domain